MNNLEKSKELFLSEIPGFKEECKKFLNGDTTKMQYKGISGGYGVYAQRDQKSFMIRLRFSSGVVTKEQLHKVYEFAKEYNLDGIHITTRQSKSRESYNSDPENYAGPEGLRRSQDRERAAAAVVRG